VLTFASVVLAVVGACLLVPIAVLLVECLAALPRTPPAPVPAGPCPQTVVLVPAHDEELVLGPTLTRLRADLPPQARILVVADNCSDETAAIARRLGLEVTERTEPKLVGKAFALAHGLSCLAHDPPDVVVVVDADCRLSEGAIATLSRAAHACGCPVQADYRMEPGPSPSVRGRISAFAFAVRNGVRPLGLMRLGLGCQLTGTGMAFPYRQVTYACAPSAEIVEDLVLGLALAELGHVPMFLPTVRVSSDQPDGHAAALAQRQRWEHGQIATAIAQGPRLFAKALAGRDRALLALALDLVVPPLALLSLLVAGHAVASTVLFALAGRAGPLLVALAALGGLALAVTAAWLTAGRRLLPLRYVVLLPFYIVWKVPMYLALVFRRKRTTWERTARAPSMDQQGSLRP
jgi:cellulose synthase/poly-beta-1,6-N-acetylglucosamine synthase-like glycosyltransferase